MDCSFTKEFLVLFEWRTAAVFSNYTNKTIASLLSITFIANSFPDIASLTL